MIENTAPPRALWVQLMWADGGPEGEGYRFDISKIKHQRELETVCQAGVRTIMRRLITGDERLDDYRETIRIGLIGGGLTPPAALRLVQTYVDERPRAESVEVAVAVLGVLSVGRPLGGKPPDDDEEAGEDADEGKPTAATTDATSEKSTAPPQQSASAHASVMN